MTTATEDAIGIPGGPVLRALRAGLAYLLGLACDEVGAATELAHPELHLAEPLARFDRVRSLLDELGGCESDESAEVDGQHRWLIAEALHEETGTLADLARSARSEGRGEAATRRRAERDAVIDYLIELGVAGGDT